jgi:hypothetical protein
MISHTCKLGLVLPEGAHGRMVALAGGSAERSPPRGAIQALYKQAFDDLLAALDAGEPIVFAAVRGAKTRVTLRLSEALCGRVRARLAALSLKLTDFACAAVQRTLSNTEGD